MTGFLRGATSMLRTAFLRVSLPCQVKATSAAESLGLWGTLVSRTLLADLSMIEVGPYPQLLLPEQGRDICGIPCIYSLGRSPSVILTTWVLGCSGLCSCLSTLHLTVEFGSGIEQYTQAQIFILKWMSHFLNLFSWFPSLFYLSPPCCIFSISFPVWVFFMALS